MRAHRQPTHIRIARARGPGILDVPGLQRIVGMRVDQKIIVPCEQVDDCLAPAYHDHRCPRHTTLSIWPSSSFEASTETGAPSALARTLGCQDEMNGTAANATRRAETGRGAVSKAAIVIHRCTPIRQRYRAHSLSS